MTLRFKCSISIQQSHRLCKSKKKVLVHYIKIQENSKREIKCQIYIISHVLLFGTYIKAKCSFFLACRIPLMWCFWRCNTSKHPRGRSKGLVIATAPSEIQITSTGGNSEISHCPFVRFARAAKGLWVILVCRTSRKISCPIQNSRSPRWTYKRLVKRVKLWWVKPIRKSNTLLRVRDSSPKDDMLGRYWSGSWTGSDLMRVNCAWNSDFL